MNGEQLARELGEINAALKHYSEKMDEIAERLEDHIEEEERRLKSIENQLSFGRFLLFTAKAIGMTLILLLTLKLGDISSVWKALIK
jgi:glucosamine 6-phosphate synthetase-like amidotransferase/phosphosugar isomerase protein